MATIPLTFAIDMQDKKADTGLSRTVKHLKDINRIIGEGNKIVSAAAKPFKVLGTAMTAPFKALKGAMDMAEVRIGQFNLATIADNVRGLSQQTGHLSDEMDAAFVGNAKTIRPMLAGLGKTGKELSRLTGKASAMAYSMNVSADTVGKVMMELESAGGPAKAGLDALNMSTKDFVKLVEVGGPATAELSAVVGDLQTSWGLSAKEAAATTDEMLAYGQAVGIGTQGLMQFKPMVDKVNAAMVDAPPGMRITSNEMQNLLKSSVKLAGAYRTMGATQEQAMEASQQTAELFIKESVAYQKALTQGGEYGDMSKKLMSVLGGWGVTWQEFGSVLREGAVDSTQGMMHLQEIVQSASVNGFGPADILMRQLLGTIGEASPAMGWLAQNVTAGKDALQQFDGMTVQSTGALKKLAKEGFSAGLTLQEQFDRGRQAMDHMIRGMAGKETRNYVQQQVAGYRSMGKRIKEMGNDKTWGPLIKNMAVLKRGGLQSLIMSNADSKQGKKAIAETFAGMDAVSSVLEDISNTAGPLMSTLGKFGPLGTMAGGFATWFALPKDARTKILKSLEPMFNTIKEKAKEIWFGSEGEGTGLKDRIQTVWEEDIKPFLKENVPKVLGGALDLALPVIKSAASSLGGALLDYLIIDPFTQGMDRIQASFGLLAHTITNTFKGLWINVKIGFYNAVTGLLDSMSNLPGIGSMMKMLGIDTQALKAGAVAMVAPLQQELKVLQAQQMGYAVGTARRIFGQEAFTQLGMQKPPAEAPLAPTMSQVPQQEYFSPAALANSVIHAQQTMAQVQGTLASSPLPETATTLGAQVTTGFAEGLMEGQPAITDSLTYVLDDVQQYVEFNSPPVKGPLSGSDTDNPAYNGGYGMMQLFATGITDGSWEMQMALENALLTSFDAAYGVYEANAAEKIKASSVMAHVADQIVQQLGGLARVDLTAQEKSVLETNIDVPGMAGVTAAIIADGNLTRKVLTRIADATEGMYTILKQGPSPTGATAFVGAPQ